MICYARRTVRTLAVGANPRDGKFQETQSHEVATELPLLSASSPSRSHCNNGSGGSRHRQGLTAAFGLMMTAEYNENVLHMAYGSDSFIQRFSESTR